MISRNVFVLASGDAASGTSLASWYSAFAHRNTIGQPFILFLDPMYETAGYSDGAFNRNPDQIRDTRRLPLFWFKTYRRVSLRGVSWSGDWLQIFVFPLSFPSRRYAPFPCPVHVPPRSTKPRCKIRARSCDFSEEGFVRADDPRKEIKSAGRYIDI